MIFKRERASARGRKKKKSHVILPNAKQNTYSHKCVLSLFSVRFSFFEGQDVS